MKFQSKKSSNDEGNTLYKKSNFPQVPNGSVTSDTSTFPMEPFKGTKSYLEKNEHDTFFNSGKKRSIDMESGNKTHCKKGKKLNFDPLNVMSKLEKFSNVWNDCPDVENPKSNFEIVPNPSKEIEVCDKKNNFEYRTMSPRKSKPRFGLVSNNNEESEVHDKESQIEHKTKKPRETTHSKWPNQSRSGVVSNCKEENTQKINEYYNNSPEDKNKILLKGKKTNQFKDKAVEINNSEPQKYDSKQAEMKRKKAVQEQSQLHAEQKNMIKKALSMDSKQKINKKIVFSDAEDNDETKTNDVSEGKHTKTQLFDDDLSDTDLKFKVNSQFEGKKGQKLLELQSKFASDSRFALDSRFQESDSDNENNEVNAEIVDINKEKRRQLEILESIVKQPIRPFSESKKVSSKRYDESSMIRFDPTREDHQKYLLKPKSQSQNNGHLEEKGEKRKKEKTSTSTEESKPKVSSEKVYAVKEDLKEVLKKESKTEFSLLKLFGSKDNNTNIEQDNSENIKKLKYATKNPFRYDSSESESEVEDKKTDKNEKDKSITKQPVSCWRTTFFFTENDSRLKEAEEFLKGPGELESDQQFADKRKMLKDFIRHKLKNSNRKKDPFKKKLGGIKKKTFHKKKGK